MNYNRAIVAGRLTRDPELKSLPSGQQVCSFALATSSTYKAASGETKEATEYHNIVVFGAAAENSARFLRKGAIALVEGKLRTSSWEKDGVKHYRTEVLADRVQFGPKISGTTEPKAASVLPDYPVDDINPDDVPF